MVVYPIAALSTDNAGADITEMYDLYMAGAAAFSDGLKRSLMLDY